MRNPFVLSVISAGYAQLRRRAVKNPRYDNRAQSYSLSRAVFIIRLALYYRSEPPFWARPARAIAPHPEFARITSYNVCYTKLLRIVLAEVEKRLNVLAEVEKRLIVLAEVEKCLIVLAEVEKCLIVLAEVEKRLIVLAEVRNNFV